MLWPDHSEPDAKGRGVVYNNQYTLSRELSIDPQMVNIHELHVKHSPKALIIFSTKARIKLTELGLESASTITSDGFAEVDINSGEETFRWVSDGKITLDESLLVTSETWEDEDDYLHMNSVDKSENGDFLISGRHTSAIYLISGRDGHVIWRLGGRKSDFEMDFSFCGQHNARFVIDDPANPDIVVISFLNNGAILKPDHSDSIIDDPTSAGLHVQLDLRAMKATVLRRFVRPDGGSTDRRGSMQTLPNGNVYMGWSYAGYVSEHAPDGRLLMEAKYVSDRFDTYRAYKFPWVGRPSYPPTLAAEVYGTNASDQTTLIYASWNGATDIAHWRIFARDSPDSDKREIATIPKSGFETSHVAQGHLDWVSVEALDSNLEVLGSSPDYRSESPEEGLQDASPPEQKGNQTSGNEGYVLMPASGELDGPKDFYESTDVHTIERGGFIPPFILGVVFSGVIFAIMRWSKLIVAYSTLAYNWMTWTGYTLIWQDDNNELDDEEVSILSQDELHALDFDDRP